MLRQIQTNGELLFYPVDNSKKKSKELDVDESVKRLQNLLDGLVRDSHLVNTQVDREILNYLDLIKGISNAPSKSEHVNFTTARKLVHCEEKRCQYLSITNMKVLAQFCGINDPAKFQAILNFFHHIGVVLHLQSPFYEIDKLVFLDPMYFIERITCVICNFNLQLAKSFKDLNAKIAYKKVIDPLMATSILYFSYLAQLWPENTPSEHEILCNCMLYFNLLVRLKKEGEHQYLCSCITD